MDVSKIVQNGIGLVALAFLTLSLPAAADPLILQGASTFNRQIIEPHRAAIEMESGHEITVVPNRSALGLIALLEGRAHMAMISAPLEQEAGQLRKALPGLDYDRLKAFEISSTRVAFVVHPDNVVRKASMEAIKKVLRGQTTNWAELGGSDAPIRIVIVGGGGGVASTVEAQSLDGQPIQGNILYVKAATQVVGVVAQERNALGLAQLSLAVKRGLPEIVTDAQVEQVLIFVTLGEPTPALKAVIDATRAAAGNAM
jgi:ABC-type phosphate transport system substrate-binding protein